MGVAQQENRLVRFGVSRFTWSALISQTFLLCTLIGCGGGPGGSDEATVVPEPDVEIPVKAIPSSSGVEVPVPGKTSEGSP
jgi:hypothetical protein